MEVSPLPPKERARPVTWVVSLPDVLKVAPRGADVGGGQVAASQGVDEAAVGTHQRLGLLGMRVADDDRLAAAEVESSGRRFVGHSLREAQGVGEGVGLALVGPHAGAAAGRAQRSVVDGYDCLEARAGVGEHCHLLMAFRAHSLENVHFRHSHCVSCTNIISHGLRYIYAMKWKRYIKSRLSRCPGPSVTIGGLTLPEVF